VVQGPGQNSDPDTAFNLRRRIYPDTYASVADPKDSISPASCRLLATEEGHIGVRSGPMEAGQDPLVGNPPGARPPGHLPLPHHHYEMPMDRAVYPHDNPARLRTHEPLPDLAYHDDGRFNYEGAPYHLGINSGWYDPSGRGPDVQYGRYHPRFLLLPPFASRPYMNMYANDNPAIHQQPGTMGRGHYTNPHLPLRSQHMTGYAEPSGAHEPVPGAYREAYLRQMSPGTAAPPSIEGAANHSVDILGTHPDNFVHPSKPPIHDAADK